MRREWIGRSLSESFYYSLYVVRSSRLLPFETVLNLYRVAVRGMFKMTEGVQFVCVPKSVKVHSQPMVGRQQPFKKL